MTNSHRSEASRNWRANWRCAATTESMSGVSRGAMPRGIPSLVASTSSPVAARHGQSLLANTRQRRKEDVLSEPADLVRVAGEHRAVGCRAPDAGRAHLAARDAIQQCRLAGSRGADHGDQDRGTRLAQPRQQVVLDLADHLLALCPRRLNAREVEQQLGPGDCVAQFEECGFELVRIDPGVRLSLVTSISRRSSRSATRPASRTCAGIGAGAAPRHRCGSRTLSLSHAHGPPLSMQLVDAPTKSSSSLAMT